MPDRDLPPPALPWWLITLGTLGLLGLYVVAVRTVTGQRVDNEILWRLEADAALAERLLPLLTYAGPVVMVGLCVLTCLYGLSRGWRTAAGAGLGAAVCLAAPQVLKLALPRPQLADPWPLPNSLPSGHAAAVAALVVALLVVVPRSARGAVLIVGSAAVGVMGLLLITLGHHRLSDIAASGCVGLIGWGLGLLVQGSGRRGPGTPPRDEDRSAQRLPRDRGGSFGGHSPSSDPSSVA